MLYQLSYPGPNRSPRHLNFYALRKRRRGCAASKLLLKFLLYFRPAVFAGRFRRRPRSLQGTLVDGGGFEPP